MCNMFDESELDTKKEESQTASSAAAASSWADCLSNWLIDNLSVWMSV